VRERETERETVREVEVEGDWSKQRNRGMWENRNAVGRGGVSLGSKTNARMAQFSCRILKMLTETVRHLKHNCLSNQSIICSSRLLQQTYLWGAGITLVNIMICTYFPSLVVPEWLVYLIMQLFPFLLRSSRQKQRRLLMSTLALHWVFIRARPN
jgi:hypothetical protein